MTWNRVITFQILAILISASVKADFIPEFQNDRAQSGNYVMYLCGSGRPNSPASMLQEVLPYMWRNLQDVLADVKLGTASQRGYRSFFKTDENKQYVQAIFQAIAEGQLLQRHSGKNTDSVLNPTFICAIPGIEGSATTKWFNDFCVDDADFARTHHTAALYEPGTNFVVLCPPMWNLPTGLTADSCPDVIGRRSRRRFSPNSDGLMRSQFAGVLHELVHLYNPFEEEGFKETYTIQDLVDLNATDSLQNPQNYVAYAAGIQAGCDLFPLSPTATEDGLKH